MFLIVTQSLDYTANYIINKYDDFDWFRLNVDRIQDYKIRITQNHWYIDDGCRMISNMDIKAIYYRKPSLPDLSKYEKRYHGMISRDIISIINGIVDSFSGTVITKPSILRKCDNKIYQLLTAKKYGFTVPDSVICNDTEYIKINKSYKQIIKPITLGKLNYGSYVECYPTSILKELQEDISLNFVYVQNYVDKLYEVRLTVILNDIYAVRIDTDNKIDWRLDYENHKYSLIQCPEYVKEACKKIMFSYQLVFCIFDFIVNFNNEWIFLEINPNGQWLWLEKKLSLEISRNIVDILKSK